MSSDVAALASSRTEEEPTGRASAPAGDGRVVSYLVSLEDPLTHCITVTMTVSGVRSRMKDGGLALAIPVWTPGSYLVREFSRNVLSLEAADRTGTRRLDVQKRTKNTWTVAVGEHDDEVVVTYLVYSFSLSTNSCYIDPDHAVINGAALFLYAEGFQDAPVSVELRLHEPWKVVATGLERVAEEGGGGGGWRFTAPGYDVLIDSPIEAGNQRVHSFEVRGVPHEVSIFAAKPIDEAKLVSDIRRIVEATVPIFGDIPYRRYVFIVDFVAEGYAGLEHLNSTHCIASYFWLEPPEEYRQLLTLFSHEFFHVWNVKRMRPVVLGPFDYSAENYTRSLWIAEGLTSYYENVILRRALILPVSEFLEHLSLPLSYVKVLPAYRWQSPEESSFDSWIRYYRQDENSPNVTPSYYTQGACLGLLLDLEIRRGSRGARTLDDVMRRVYADTFVAHGRGFTDGEFEKACDQASAGATAEIFASYVHSKEAIDFERYLGLAGLILSPKSQPSPEEGFLGIRVKSGPTVTVLTRLRDSPAEACDLSPGDEVIATDGLRTDGPRFSFYVANRKPGSELELTIARGGVLKTIRGRVGAKPVFDYRLQKRAAATDEEKALFGEWAHADWDDPISYTEHRTSPTRNRTLDYF